MLYVLVALALPHGYGHRRHRERFRHDEEGVAEQQIDALTLKLEKLEDKVDELMISNAERTRTQTFNCSPPRAGGRLPASNPSGLDELCEVHGEGTAASPPAIGCTPKAVHQAGPDSNRSSRPHVDGTWPKIEARRLVKQIQSEA